MALIRCSILTLFGVFIIGISLDNAQGQSDCTKQFTTVRSCFNQLDARDARADAPELRSLQKNLDTQKIAAQTCLQRQGCLTDTTDPKQLATKECLRRTKKLMQDQINECMAKKGNTDFEPEFDQKPARTQVSPDDEQIDIRAAAKACEIEKGQEGLARDIKLCVADELESKRTAGTRASSSLVQTAFKVNKYCENKKTCLSRFSGQCADDICACFEETSKATDVVGEYRSCLKFKLETANVEGDDAEKAEEILFQNARDWFPFCIPSDEDDSCDEENGVVAKAVDAVSAAGGGNDQRNSLIKQLIGSDRTEQLSIFNQLKGLVG